VILYLMRHSIAVKDGEGTNMDSDRPLTDEGMEKANEVACGLEHILDPLDLPKCIYTSPAKRCYQTGEIIQKHWEVKPSLEAMECLAEDYNLDDMVEFAESLNDEPAMLVMHKPDIHKLLGTLIDAGEEPCIDFKRCSVAKVEFEGDVKVGEGKLCWLYNPWIIRQFS